MHPKHSVTVLVGIVGLVVAALLTSGSSFDVPAPSHRAVTVTLPAGPSIGGDWEAEAQAAKQARDDAIAALTAQQAQDLADQLHRAAQRLQDAPGPSPAPVVSSGPAPCYAPNVPLSWIAWCESGCSPTSMNHGGSGAAGKYQYLYSTWNQYGGYDNAAVAPEYVQDQRAAEDYASKGTGPWEASRGCWGGKF